MFRVSLDKIASATKNAGIENEVYVSENIIAKEGYVIAVRILNDKIVYNTLENIHGRMMRLKPGDVIAGVLGARRALRGYSGGIPPQINPGDRLNILNLGGVIGKCTSHAPHVGEPFEAEVIGAVLHFPYIGERSSTPAHIKRGAIDPADHLEESAPIIAVVGTCMNAGKTVAACRIIHGLTRRGLKIAAAKVTGVALQKDILNMADHGAVQTLSFNDAGLTSTNPDTALNAAKSIVATLNRNRPDAIVIEFGDGLLGEYGVQSILGDKEFSRHIVSTVLCANDPVGAYGAVPLLKEQYNLQTTVIAGPVTDNDVGTSYIRSSLKIPAANALINPQALTEHVLKKVFS